MHNRYNAENNKLKDLLKKYLKTIRDRYLDMVADGDCSDCKRAINCMLSVIKPLDFYNSYKALTMSAFHGFLSHVIRQYDHTEILYAYILKEDRDDIGDVKKLKDAIGEYSVFYSEKDMCDNCEKCLNNLAKQKEKPIIVASSKDGSGDDKSSHLKHCEGSKLIKVPLGVTIPSDPITKKMQVFFSRSCIEPGVANAEAMKKYKDEFITNLTK